MRVTLINPPWFFPGTLDRLSQNNGLGYIASFLRTRADIEVSVIDALAEGMQHCRPVPGTGGIIEYGLDYEEIARRVPDDSDLVGITGPFTYHQKIVTEIIKEIRRRLNDVKIALGGVLPSTLPENALDTGADYIVRGEGEKSFTDLCLGKDPYAIPARLYGILKQSRMLVGLKKKLLR